MKDESNELTEIHAQWDHAVNMQLSGVPVPEIAETLGVSKSTIYKWRMKPAYRRKYHEAQARISEGIINRVGGACEEAVNTLKSALKCGDDKIQVDAADKLLRHYARLSEPWLEALRTQNETAAAELQIQRVLESAGFRSNKAEIERVQDTLLNNTYDAIRTRLSKEDADAAYDEVRKKTLEDLRGLYAADATAPMELPETPKEPKPENLPPVDDPPPDSSQKTT